jgi:hypothetical protein
MLGRSDVRRLPKKAIFGVYGLKRSRRRLSATQKEVSMANVSYWQASWVSMEGYPMSPGDVHYWEASPLGYLEAWSVTAVPIAGGEDPTAILGVEDVRVIADASGSRGFLFSVKNVGTSYIDGYGMNFSIVSQ